MTTTEKPRSSREAIMLVLEEAEGPMKASEIADKILERKLAPKLAGKTPKATIAAQVYTAAKRGELKKTKAGFQIASVS